MADKIAEGDLIRLMVLTIEFIISLCLSATSLSKSARLEQTGSLNGSNLVTPNETVSQAIASVVLFSVVGLLLYILSIVLCVVKLWRKKSKVQKLCKKNLARSIFVAIGGLFYYIGDNLPPLLEEYAEELRCSPNCVEGAKVTGIVMLAIATTAYLPITINAVFTNNKDEDDLDEDIPAHIAIFLLLAKVTDLDLVYTSIERIIPGTCDTTIVGGTWAYYAFYLVVFSVVTGYAVVCIFQSATFTKKRTRLVVNAVLICVFMACYILADNRLPLGCSGLFTGDRLARDIVKVVLFALTSIVFTYSVIIFGWWYFHEKIHNTLCCRS